MKITNNEKNSIVDIVKNAIRITEWFRVEGYQSFTKQDQSPVTVADFASQIYIISKLKEIYPDDSIIAEESSSLMTHSTEKLIQSCYNELNIIIEPKFRELLNYRGFSSKDRWTIDPIDGTKGFQKGLSYAIGIGLISNEEKLFSIIGVPNYKCNQIAIFIAKKGKGAKVAFGENEFSPIEVGDKKNMSDYTLCHSLHYDEPWVMKLANIIGIEKFIQIDSMAKFCMIADGTADLYIKPMDRDHSYIWDFLPGDLLVTEAGGIVTDLTGRDPKYINEKCVISAPGLLVSNGRSHKDIIKIIKNTPNLFD